MKAKVTELTGYKLDLVVSKCEGGAPEHYSTDWAHGGPIIERNRIEIAVNLDGDWYASMWVGKPVTARDHNSERSSPLVAAMRCYVLSRMGEEVDI